MRFPQFAGEIELTDEEEQMFRQGTDWTEGPRIFMGFKPQRDTIEFTIYYRSLNMIYRSDYEIKASDFVAVTDFLGEETAYNALLFVAIKNRAREDAEWADNRHVTLFPKPLTEPVD